MLNATREADLDHRLIDRILGAGPIPNARDIADEETGLLGAELQAALGPELQAQLNNRSAHRGVDAMTFHAVLAVDRSDTDQLIFWAPWATRTLDLSRHADQLHSVRNRIDLPPYRARIQRSSNSCSILLITP